MKLSHPFVNKIPNIDELFLKDDGTDCIQTVNAFCSRVSFLAEKYESIIDANMFKGDALEIFVEYMIRTDGSDNRIGIYDPRIISETENEDLGVDLVGKGENGFPATVQVKFRTGDYVLTANEDHLSNFLTSSWSDFCVRLEDTKNMLIITTGLKVDDNTLQKMLKGKVRVLNREALRSMYDNRQEWWKRFYESIKESRVKTDNRPTLKSLRPHQQEAIDKIFSAPDTEGMIILPTGTGKTMIESEAICRFLIEAKTKTRKEMGIPSDNSFEEFPPIIKMNSSRILLCFQLFDDVLGRMIGHGLDARWVNYNSGDKDDTEFAYYMRQSGMQYREVISTTNYNEVMEIYEKCKQEKLPLIVFSTYHSAEKFDKCGLKPDITIHDEAHNLASVDFYKCAKLTQWHNYYFTATTKSCGYLGGIGMDNPEIFDELLFSKGAKELIESGEIVPPQLHIIRSHNRASLDTDYEMMMKSVFEGFEKHSNHIAKLSFDKTEISPKVLVVCRGQLDLIEMFKTKAFEQYKKEHKDIHFFALSSEFGIYDNGVKIEAPVTNKKKYDVLKKLKGLSNGDKAIIFHVDMIGEGIDVPGITGIMPFRNCNLTKLVQNIGRSMRLHIEDRKKIYKNELSTLDRKNWIKPYAWIIIPSYMVDIDGIENRILQIVTAIKNEFGYIPNEVDIIDRENGLSDDTLIDTVNTPTKNHPHTKCDIDDFDHEFENLHPVFQILVDEAICVNTKKNSDKILLNGFKMLEKPIKSEVALEESTQVIETEQVTQDYKDEDFVMTDKKTSTGLQIYRFKVKKQGRPKDFVKVDDKYILVRTRSIRE